MRVVVDATPLLIRSAGVKNYLYYWIESLQRAAASGVIRTFPDLDRLPPLQHEVSVSNRWRTVTGLATLAASNYSPFPVLDWMIGDADLFHATNLVRHPPRLARLTATIYDMTPTIMPEMHTPATIRADRAFTERIRSAAGLIAISQSTADDAARLLGIRPEKMAVIHPGIPAKFFHIDSTNIERVRQHYKLTRPFVLSMGTIEPRKNLDTLLDAYELLPASTREEFGLVVAGPSGWAAPRTLARLKTIRYLGYVPETDAAPLTAAATVFAYPSLYEGFGFPVAQAMAAGVPVITSNVSSLPEVTGEAAVLVDPRSVTELRDALRRLLSTPRLRAEMAQRGRERASRFQWQTCALESLRFFESVVRG